MKAISIFFLLTALVTPHGSCLSLGEINSTIRPSDITPRDGLSKLSPPIDWIGSKELITRQPDGPRTKTQLAVEFVVLASMTALAGISLLGIVGDCKELQKDDSNTNGVVCVGGSIATAISIASVIKNNGMYFYELAKAASIKALDYAASTTFAKFVGGYVGAMGPFMRPPTTLPGGKRDDSHIFDSENSHLFKRVEEHLTSRFQVDVRYIGFWDGSTRNDSHADMIKRGEDGTIPTYALNIERQDVHFAYMGLNSANQSTVKIGHGPGPETKENKRRLKPRWFNSDYPRYNNYYFDKGGFDMIVTADIDEGHAAPEPEVSSNDYDYPWIYSQIMCYLGADDPRSYMAGRYPEQLNSGGFWFQMYDTEFAGTVMAGALAPFSATVPSIIQWLQPEGSIALEEKCSV